MKDTELKIPIPEEISYEHEALSQLIAKLFVSNTEDIEEVSLVYRKPLTKNGITTWIELTSLDKGSTGLYCWYISGFIECIKFFKGRKRS